MARGIQDIANNLGFVYMTEVDGSTIISSQPNSAAGVRNMRDLGSTVAPFAAQRSAYGILEVTTAAATGNVTAVNVNGVNQIGTNIPIASADTTAAATLIAAGINSFTPGSGPDCVASSFGPFVFIFTPPNVGAASNGYAVGYSATGGALVATTTAMAYGSSESGVYDSVIGRRFFLNANYDANGVSGGQAATATSLTNSVEITEYMVMRGLQTGIGTLELTVNTDSLPSVDRFCAIMQLITTNQGGAATDNLEFINPIGFVEGDIIFIRSADTAQVLTVVDAANASVSSTPNIYLTDSSNFVIQSNKMLMLRYTFDSILGGIFVEMSRSVSNSVITLTRSAFNTLIGARTLVPGAMYLITDIGDNGVYLSANNVDSYNATGTLWRRIPTNYTSCWRADMTLPGINQYYRYYQNVYQSVTGAIGTAPDTDTVNWLLIAKSNVTYYATEYHEVGVATNSSPYILWERDLANNFVSQSSESSGIGNAFNAFAWQIKGIGLVYGNTVIDSILDCANSDGTVYDNTLINGSVFTTNSLRSTSIVARNFFRTATVTGNYVDIIFANTVTGESNVSGLITSNGGAGAYFYQIANCNVIGGRITANTSSGPGNKEISNCTVNTFGEIKNNVFASTSKIRYTTVDSASEISGCTFLVPMSDSNIETCNISNASNLTITESGGGGRLIQCVLNFSNLTIAVNGFTLTAMNLLNSTIDWTPSTNSSEGSSFELVTATFTGALNNCIIKNITVSGTPTFVYSGQTVIGGESSTIITSLDLDDPSIFAANIFTISNNDQLSGVFYLSGTGAKNIQEIVNLPLFKEVRFWSASSALVATFTKVAPGAWFGNLIVGAADFILESNAASPSDLLVMNKLAGGTNTIIQTVKLV